MSIGLGSPLIVFVLVKMDTRACHGYSDSVVLCETDKARLGKDSVMRKINYNQKKKKKKKKRSKGKKRMGSTYLNKEKRPYLFFSLV